MKKLLALVILSGALVFSGCEKNFSNIDVLKLNQKASQYMQNGEYDKAIARLESVIDINPDYPETYFNLGIAYYQSNNYEKSLAAFDEAIKRKINFADAYYSKAVALEDCGYAILNGENIKTKTNTNQDDNNEEKPVTKKEITETDKALAKDYLKKAITNYEKYTGLKTNATDKSEVADKIAQLKKYLEDFDNLDFNKSEI